MPLIADILQPQHFYHDHHQTIYTAILALFSGGQPIDLITVTKQQRQQGLFQIAEHHTKKGPDSMATLVQQELKPRLYVGAPS